MIRIRSGRFAGLASRVVTAQAWIDNAKTAELRSLVEASNAAKSVATIAANKFKETPGILPGTGGEAWKALFEAARAFAVESHPGREFPHFGPEAACPLCQNPLGESGESRLVAFDAFVQQEAEKAAKSARALATAAYKAIDNGNLDLLIDDGLTKELADADGDVATACNEIGKALLDRRESIKKAAGKEIEWEAIPALPPDPSEALSAMAARLEAEAKVLEESMNQKAKSAMIVEQAELEARRGLAAIKPLVVDAIDRFILCGKLQSCIDSLGTTGISRKSTELSKTMATQEVADSLNAELQDLNVHDLKVGMKPESPGGKTQFKLALQLPGGGVPSAILSEGEQRAIAIASFLAEVNLGKGLGGVVFDDPVSSLDHIRRERVAKRLAREALARQVIVFTHDLYFLNVLMHEAGLTNAEPACLSLRRSPAGMGVADAALPFEGASTKDRVGQLRQMQVECATLRRDGDDIGYRRAARDTYAHLRMAWERAVEELLFNGVVVRFRKGIETNRLGRVVVEPGDVTAIQNNMTRCSAFTGHDGALDANPAMPEPAEISADIEALETWRKATDERAKRQKH